MGESKQHHDLVDMISDYIVEYFDISDSIIFRDGVDSGMALPGGSKPDLLCEFDDQIIIGEAKIGTDIENDHTKKQFKEYLSWCNVKRNQDGLNPLIIYGVPSDYAKTTKNYLQKIRSESNLEDIQFLVKTPMGMFQSDGYSGGESGGSKIIFRNEKPLVAKIEAFEYQKKAVEKIKDLEYAAIFHEQGLGKTKIAIDLMLYWFNSLSIDSVVIVTKKSLIGNWKRELSHHTNLSYTEVGTNMSSNYIAFNTAKRIILTNFESFLKENERFDLLAQSRITGIIIDESAKIKNPSTKIAIALHRSGHLYKKRVIMTGTPVANRPYDIWSQIYFLDQGKSLGTNFSDFKKKTNLSNKMSNSVILQEQFVEEVGLIFDKIRDFTVRETKNSGIITLPPKEYHNIDLSFDIEQKSIYDRVCKEVSNTIVKDGISIEDDLSEVIKRLIRLVEVTSNPSLVDESYKKRPVKMTALSLLLEDINNREEKSIVWTSYIDNVKEIMELAREYNPVSFSGDMDVDEREQSISKFISDPDVKVLVATYAAKEGLTLTVANNAIFYDRTMNLDDYLQAQDRIHRISQSDICHIYNLRIVDSIDEWIDRLIESKHLSAMLAQGDMSASEFNNVMDYSFGEIIHKILGEIDG